MLNIVLHEPEIPFNTGAIGRTCLATGTRLHLIKPYGFKLSDKYIKRAGMDYWQHVDLHEYDSFQDFLDKNPEILSKDEDSPRLWFATTKSEKTYSDASYGENDYIMFGRESAGIPEEILIKHKDSSVRIPMWGEIRSLNLSNSVAIMLYEALRQNDFPGLNRMGELHKLTW